MKMKLLVVASVVLVQGGVARAEIKTKEVSYQCKGVNLKGYFAWDDAVKGARPGVLVVHEWWGLNDYAKKRAEQLAQLGYVAFAADMYGEGKNTNHPDDARKMATEVRSNVEQWRQRALAALDVLKSQPQCDKTKLAAIGYCFGGSTALQLAYAGADLSAGQGATNTCLSITSADSGDKVAEYATARIDPLASMSCKGL